MSVYVTEGGYQGKRSNEEVWQLLHKKTHKPSVHELIEMSLMKPIVIRKPKQQEDPKGHQALSSSSSTKTETETASAGSTVGIYIHSALENDEGLVYDNLRLRTFTSTDQFIQIHPGVAHISSIPFDDDGYWGWGAWRERRSFVGRLTYGKGCRVHCSWCCW
jgi:hypothetical protein